MDNNNNDETTDNERGVKFMSGWKDYCLYNNLC